MVVKFRNTICPPLQRSSPFIGGLRCKAIQTEHGPYIGERSQKAVYIVRCLWVRVEGVDELTQFFAGIFHHKRLKIK
jgi:hypothetical protein